MESDHSVALTTDGGLPTHGIPMDNRSSRDPLPQGQYQGDTPI